MPKLHSRSRKNAKNRPRGGGISAPVIRFYRKWKTVSQRRKHLCLDCLQTSKTVSLYENKKRGEKVSEKDCQFYLAAPVPQGDIVLVDNVIATGTTVSAAQRTLGRRCAVAVVAVDSKENNK